MNEALTEHGLLLTVFSIGESLWAVDALHVQEIIRVSAITRVHHALPEVVGIINLRGRIVTILDPAYRLGLPAGVVEASARILVLDWKDEQIGLLVSRIQDVVSVEASQLAPPPSNMKQAFGAHLAKVVRIKDQAISVLDLETILAIEEAH